MSKKIKSIEDVIYTHRWESQGKKHTTSINVIGIDTEADDTGKCFMIATSEYDIFDYSEYPQCFFNRRYQGCNFVAYNLKYDEGALLQFVDIEHLKELREQGKTEYNGYVITIIPRKLLSIRRGKNTFHVYDMYNFYLGSLDYNAKKYLGKQKEDIDTKTFTQPYIERNYCGIAYYCIIDSVLVQELAELLISKFESFGVPVRKLYSTAYISYQYFKTHTKYITVKRFWDNDKKVLDFAMRSYNGGKFEVTEKGPGYYYEYDIVSAYPYEISNLVDISNARAVWSNKYRKYATYAFIHVRMKIPVEVFSPVALKHGDLNVYPSGQIDKVITLTEYDYLIKQGCDITIINGVWLHIDKKEYPYKSTIEKLVAFKHQYKAEGKKLDYHTIKIFLNSIYGKMCQLIEKKGKLYASNCWNPIYASVITSNVRCRITEYQQKFPSVVAVHTDSIISREKLPGDKTDELGNMIYEEEGDGIILGSGIYQVGTKSRFRGFNLRKNLIDVIHEADDRIIIESVRPYTWREVAFHNWSHAQINRFVKQEKEVRCNFDQKRIWFDDWQSFAEVEERTVLSLPHYNTFLGV